MLSIMYETNGMVEKVNKADRNIPIWPWLRAASQLTGISAIIFGVLYAVPALKRFGGLFERGIYVGALLWLGLVIVPLVLSPVAVAVQTGG